MANDWSTWINQNILTGKVRFKNNTGHDFPEWETTKLKDILECTTSKHELRDIDHAKTGKYPIYNNGAVYKHIPTYDVETDYIAINFAGSPGNCWLLPGCTSVNSTQAYLTLKDDADVNLVWVFANVCNIHFDKYIQGSTIRGLRWNDFKREVIPLPCNDEQNKCGNFISDFAKMAKLVEEELYLWKLLKKAMMQRLFL